MQGVLWELEIARFIMGLFAGFFFYHAATNLSIALSSEPNNRQRDWERTLLAFYSGAYCLASYFMHGLKGDRDGIAIFLPLFLFLGSVSIYYYIKVFQDHMAAPSWSIKTLLRSFEIVNFGLFVCLAVSATGHMDLIFDYVPVDPEAFNVIGYGVGGGTNFKPFTLMLICTTMANVCYLIAIVLMIRGYQQKRYQSRLIAFGAFLSGFTLLYTSATGIVFTKYYLPLLFFANYPEVFRQSIVAQMEAMSRLRDLRDMRERQIEKARHESTNMLAGGVAHEINNPLAVAIGYIERISEDPDSVKWSIPLAKIKASHLRISRVTTALLNVADQKKAGLKNVDAQDMMEDVKAIFSGLNSGSAEVIVNVPEGTRVFCEVQSIQLALIELLKNAREANSKSGGKKIYVNVSLRSDEISFEVKDQGFKLLNSQIEKMQDPFFTTKEIGESMGLGLSLVRSAVERNNGSLEFLSHSDGTVAIIRLPMRRSAKAA